MVPTHRQIRRAQFLIVGNARIHRVVRGRHVPAQQVLWIRAVLEKIWVLKIDLRAKLTGRMRLRVLIVRPANGEILGDIVPPKLLKDGQPLLLVSVLVGKVAVVFIALAVVRRGAQRPRAAQVQIPTQREVEIFVNGKIPTAVHYPYPLGRTVLEARHEQT